MRIWESLILRLQMVNNIVVRERSFPYTRNYPEPSSPCFTSLSLSYSLPPSPTHSHTCSPRLSPCMTLYVLQSKVEWRQSAFSCCSHPGLLGRIMHINCVQDGKAREATRRDGRHDAKNGVDAWLAICTYPPGP